MSDKVKTVCYGMEREWDSREEAMEFFWEGMNCCEGSEKERYTNIYMKLASGLDVCDDSEKEHKNEHEYPSYD